MGMILVDLDWLETLRCLPGWTIQPTVAMLDVPGRHVTDLQKVPSGKLTQEYGKIHHFLLVNSHNIYGHFQ